METLLASIFTVALDKLFPKIGTNEKSAASLALSKIAVDYFSGKSVDVSQLKPVEEMDIDALLRDYLSRKLSIATSTE